MRTAQASLTSPVEGECGSIEGSEMKTGAATLRTQRRGKVRVCEVRIPAGSKVRGAIERVRKWEIGEIGRSIVYDNLEGFSHT